MKFEERLDAKQATAFLFEKYAHRLNVNWNIE